MPDNDKMKPAEIQSATRSLVLDRRDEMGVTNYWIAKRASGSIPTVYNFLEGRSDPNLKTLESVLELVGLKITRISNFTKAE